MPESANTGPSRSGEPSAPSENKLFDEGAAARFRARLGGPVLDCDAEFAAKAGYESPDQVKGVPEAQIYEPELERERLRERLRTEERVREFRGTLRRRDGSTLEVVATLTLREGPDPGDEVYEGVLFDVTAAHRPEDWLRESRDLLDAVARGTSDLVFVKDREGRYLYVNRAFSEALGLDGPEEAIGETDEAVLSSGDARRIRQEDRAIMESGDRTRFEETVTVEGDDRVYDTVKAPLRDAGEIRGIIGIARDVTARKAAERELQRARDRFEQVFRVTPLALSVATIEDGRFLDVNRGFEETYGWSAEEVVGRTAEELDLWVDPPERGRMVERLEEEGYIRQLETRVRARDGRILDMLLSAEPAEVDGERCVVTAAQDITDRKAIERQLERLALHDALTGLANRSLFRDRLEHALERSERSDTSVAVIFLDLDRFKNVNDTLGHSARDRLLEMVAERLSEVVREEDTLARLGGDEFAVLLEDVDSPRHAERAAERIAAAFRRSFDLGDMKVPTDASIGIALGEGDTDRAEDLMRFSDVAMYRMKGREGTGIHVFDPDVDHAQTLRLHRENDLRRALAEDEICVHYQPIVDLEDGRILAAEALARWEHPEKGLLPPADFIPLAEETGLIVPLGRAVLREAMFRAGRWHREIPSGREITLSVNLSAEEYQDPALSDAIRENMAESGLPGDSLQLEITESVLMTGEGKTRALRDAGARLAIDDFGTGYSSLEYLKRLDADVLKIDRTFVRDLDLDDRSSVIVRAVLMVARQMGMEVLVEGVETPSQRQHLVDLGCLAGQGYHFAHPMPAGEMEELLRTGARLPVD